VKTSLNTISEAGGGSGLGAPIDSLERLLSLTAEDVDDLPYGFIILDAQGTILLYNRYEAALARTTPEHVLGRNFFRDIAPCTRVAAFFGRFREVAEAEPGASRRFAFRFHFLHGAQDVLVQITRAPDLTSADDPAAIGRRIFMTVVRQKIVSERAPRPPQLTLEPRSGRVVGPLGPAFPLGAQALHLALRTLGESAARELGREAGREIGAVVKAAVAELSGRVPELTPPQLIAGALDDTLANAGLGRVALDFTDYADRSVVGCLLRPPIDLPARAFAAFYEGLLGVATGTLLNRTLVARCLDSLDLRPTPWLFTLGPASAL
jgi:photoactive yellow protein